jgi:hypothetical protein
LCDGYFVVWGEEGVMRVVIPVFLVDHAIVELRRRSGSQDRILVSDATDVLLELREYAMGFEDAEQVLRMTGHLEGG